MGAFIEQTISTFEAMAITIADLRKRVEALEQPQGEPLTKVDPTFTMPMYKTLDESDRSHVVSVGESHYHL
jgi:hypothetical protein